MARTTSFHLDDDLDSFVQEQVDSGAYSSASEVVLAALQHMAEQYAKEKALYAALDEGDRSGTAPPRPWDRVRARTRESASERRKRRGGEGRLQPGDRARP